VILPQPALTAVQPVDGAKVAPDGHDGHEERERDELPEDAAGVSSNQTPELARGARLSFSTCPLKCPLPATHGWMPSCVCAAAIFPEAGMVLL
jgi:hypothetical protein